MYKEFVPYNESLELKAIGFNEPCICGYSRSTEQLETYSRFLVTKDSFTVDAPTFSQAFEFFREKYQMVFCYEPCLKKDLIYIFFIYVETTGEKIFVVESKYNKEAELSCLRKLIEIVKKQITL